MLIGRVGSTGKSTGPHLHFEVRHTHPPSTPSPAGITPQYEPAPEPPPEPSADQAP